MRDSHAAYVVTIHFIAMGGDNDNSGVGRYRPDILYHPYAIHDRHVDVADNDVRFVRIEQFQSCLPVFRLMNHKVRKSQGYQFAGDLSGKFVIFDKEEREARKGMIA